MENLVYYKKERTKDAEDYKDNHLASTSELTILDVFGIA